MPHDLERPTVIVDAYDGEQNESMRAGSDRR